MQVTNFYFLQKSDFNMLTFTSKRQYKTALLYRHAIATYLCQHAS